MLSSSRDVVGVLAFVVMFGTLLGCSDSHDNETSDMANVMGAIKGGNRLFPDEVFENADVFLVKDGEVMKEAKSSLSGRFEIADVPFGEYELRVEKEFPFGNRGFHFSSIEIDSSFLDLGDVGLDSLLYDYFPLAVGNSWTYEGYFCATCLDPDVLRVLTVTDSLVRNDTLFVEYIGEDIPLNVHPDDMLVAGGYGSQWTSFLVVVNGMAYDPIRFALWGRHVYTDGVLGSLYELENVYESELVSQVGPVHAIHYDNGVGTSFLWARDIGMASRVIFNGGNNPSYSAFVLIDYQVVR